MPKFLVDSMIGKLARFLRLLGFDTAYFADKADAELVDIAFQEDRIILTRDTQLIKVKKVQSIFIKSLDLKKQIEQIIKNLKLKIKKSCFFSRCLDCNYPLEKIEKEKVSDRVPRKSFEGFEEFWICKNCDHVYWPGSHYENMLKKIRMILNI